MILVCGDFHELDSDHEASQRLPAISLPLQSPLHSTHQDYVGQPPLDFSLNSPLYVGGKHYLFIYSSYSFSLIMADRSSLGQIT